MNTKISYTTDTGPFKNKHHHCVLLGWKLSTVNYAVASFEAIFICGTKTVNFVSRM